MGEFRMPSLGADMTEGTLLEWLVAPGDLVRHGQIVAVVDTVKSAIDIEAFEDGEVDRLLVAPGETVSVGTPLALIGPVEGPATGSADAVQCEPAARPALVGAGLEADAENRPVAPAAQESHHRVSPLVRRLAHDLDVDLDTVRGTGRDGTVTRDDVRQAAVPPGTSQEPAAVTSRRGTHVGAAPRARRLADQLGVDLRSLQGSGPGGAVTAEDVERAARDAGSAAPPVAPPSSPPEPARRSVLAGTGRGSAVVRTEGRKDAMQAATAALMARSKREIPHYYLESAIDLKAALDWLAVHNQGRAPGDRVLPAALLLKATATCLLGVPELNGFYADDRFEPADHVDLGVAVSLRGGGLLVASLRGADALSVDELMSRLKDVATRARAGRLTSSEMSVPTVTVTNLGEQGADLVHGVIYPPQVALVGFGRINERPWAVDGLIGVRPVVVATLAGDHRVTDGHRGSRFLEALDAALQNPEEL